MADEIVDIADDSSGDYVKRMVGGAEMYVVNHEHIARSRLRVDTRKWILAKMLPRVFGDKSAVEIAGRGGGPVEIAAVPKLEVARWIAHLLTHAATSVDGGLSDAVD